MSVAETARDWSGSGVDVGDANALVARNTMDESTIMHAAAIVEVEHDPRQPPIFEKINRGGGAGEHTRA